MAGYSGTPLAKKLGIRSGDRVGLIEPPEGFEDLLTPLPENAETRRGLQAGEDYPVVVLFSLAADQLAEALPRATRHLPATGGLWVAWPKKASKIDTDLSFDIVQRAGLDLGLVDNKVCAVDETWSGLRFVVRKEDRAAWRQ
jgi:hypothetical protein